jgi:predicted RNase H-like nuclease (RuvC/YqgF family)
MASQTLENVKREEEELCVKEAELRKAREVLVLTKKAALNATSKCLEEEIVSLEHDIKEQRKKLEELKCESRNLDRAIEERVAANVRNLKEVEVQLERSSKRHVIQSASVFLNVIDDMGVTRFSVPVDRDEVGVSIDVSDGMYRMLQSQCFV